MTYRELLAARAAARTIDPERLARLAEREARARAHLAEVLADLDETTVPGYRVVRLDGTIAVEPMPDALPPGWAQLEAFEP